MSTPQSMEERVPIELFKIRNLIAKKFPKTPSKVQFLARHVEALRNTPKYAINLHSD